MSTIPINVMYDRRRCGAPCLPEVRTSAVAFEMGTHRERVQSHENWNKTLTYRILFAPKNESFSRAKNRVL